jgi:hypothetical protein
MCILFLTREGMNVKLERECVVFSVGLAPYSRKCCVVD